MDLEPRDIPPLPLDLRIVAWLFITGGCLAIMEVLVSCAASRISVNFGVLGVFIGFGLLRLSSGWRVVALIFLWTLVLVIPLIMLGLAPRDLQLMCLCAQIGNAGYQGVLIGLFGWLFFAFQTWVLSRQEVRDLFREHDGLV